MDTSTARRPSVPVSAAARPSVPSSSAPRPVRSRSVAPAGTIPPQPQKAVEIDVLAEMPFGVTVAVAPSVAISASAELPAPDVSVMIVPEVGTFVMSVDAEMPATADALAKPALEASAELPITASAAAVPALAPASEMQFDVTVAMYKMANQGIDKSGDQALATTDTWTRLTPWVARTGYPATVVEGDGIRVPAGLTATYEYRMSVGSAPGSTQSQSARLLNGAAVVDSATINNTATSTTRTGTFVGTGDIVRLEASVTTTGGRGTITSATYLVVNVV